MEIENVSIFSSDRQRIANGKLNLVCVKNRDKLYRYEHLFYIILIPILKNKNIKFF